MENHFLSSTNFNFKNKTILVRVDCDVDLKQGENGLEVDGDYRLRSDLPTIKFLLEKGAGKIILMGHMGRPEGKVVEELSLKPVAQKFEEFLNSNVKTQKSKLNVKCQNFDGFEISDNIILLENLRFDIREEENNEGFTKELVGLGDVYINEDFSVSHREHASVVGIPKLLPGFLGLRFEKETQELGNLRNLSSEKRPLVFVLGGSKKDKLDYLEFLGEWCDKVLVGGKLPLLITNNQAPNSKQISNSKFLISKQFLKLKIKNLKFAIAELNPDSKDINKESLNRFKEEIEKAMTVVWAGPMGVYEEKENEQGTFEIAKAITESSAYKVAGGGDTLRILNWLKIEDKFDFVSVGGGAMLYFLKEGSLSGISAVRG